MKCVMCGAKLKPGREDVKWDACGLPNVVLRNIEVRRCPSCGEYEVVIPRIEDLHKKLAGAILRKQGRLTGAEVRFLRKFLDWSGVEFARRAGVAAETVSRWENSREPMSATAERFLRLAVAHFAPLKGYSVEALDDPDKGHDAPVKIKAKAARKGWALAVA